MGRRGRLRVERLYTTERMVRSTEGVYRVALGRGGINAAAASA